MIVKLIGAEEWCAACRTLRPVLEKECSRRNWTMIALDVDHDLAEVAKLGCFSLPTTILEDLDYKNQGEIGRFEGAYSPAGLQKVIDKILENARSESDVELRRRHS